MLDATTPAPSDSEAQKQQQALSTLRAAPYFRYFEPRAYPLYEQRHYQPTAYLEQVGIEKIGEMVQHGLCLQDICESLSISTQVVRRWLVRNPAYAAELDEARRFAADGLVATAEKILRDPVTFPDTTRAIALSHHLEWKAERWDKDTYGTKQGKQEDRLPPGVSYTFILNAPAVQKATRAVIEGVARALPERGPVPPLLPSLDFSDETL
jgi:hypothetical protein